jgi:multidrug resistance protein, MATE family
MADRRARRLGSVYPFRLAMTSSPAPVRLGVLLTLAWPIVLSRSTQAIIGFCDALMTAPLGEGALAATTAGALNVFSIAILPMGVAFIVQSFAAQLSGAGDLVGARRYGWYGLILSGVAGLLAVVSIPLVGPVLGLFDYEPAVGELMGDYMAIRLASLGAIVGMEAIGNWFGGLGNTRQQMVASVMAMVANVVLNWVLIYGELGFPALGVQGAALASSLASVLGLVYLLVVFLLRAGVARPTEVKPGAGRLRWSEVVRTVRFGLPNGLNWFLEFAAFILFINVVMTHLGTAALAAFMVVLNINSVSFMPAFGLSSAGAILVGQTIGAGRHDDVPAIVKLTARTAAVWQCSVGLIYLSIPATLMSFFAPPGSEGGSEMLRIGGTLLALSAIWQLFDALAMSVGEALRAAGDTAWCLYARLVLAWLFFMPVSVVAVMVLDGGHVPAILSVAAYIALLAGVLIWRFRGGKWRNIDLTGAREQQLPT